MADFHIAPRVPRLIGGCFVNHHLDCRTGMPEDEQGLAYASATDPSAPEGEQCTPADGNRTRGAHFAIVVTVGGANDADGHRRTPALADIFDLAGDDVWPVRSAGVSIVVGRPDGVRKR